MAGDVKSSIVFNFHPIPNAEIQKNHISKRKLAEIVYFSWCSNAKGGGTLNIKRVARKIICNIWIYGISLIFTEKNYKKVNYRPPEVSEQWIILLLFLIFFFQSWFSNI